VSDCGHGGQIVVTDKTRAAVADLLPSGVTFRSLGEHRLPGLPQAEALFQIRAKGLRTRFPELRRTGG
jgi:class 3 adenylate cyclase